MSSKPVNRVPPHVATLLFQQFTGLHQTSTALFMFGFVAALICLACMTQFRSRAAAPRSNPA